MDEQRIGKSLVLADGRRLGFAEHGDPGGQPLFHFHGSQGLPAQTRRTPDLDIQHEWAVEFKMVRPFGDDGKEAENWPVNMLHPYPGNVSLIGDAVTLSTLQNYRNKGLFVIGYEHNPPRISLNPLFEAFELIAGQVMHLSLDTRIEERREGLVHPKHQVLRCVGWQLR